MIRTAFLLACLVLFAVDLSAQADAAASEIEGFRFSSDEKVKGLTLLVSTREDVQRIFGKDCVNGCQFNDDWDISFAYVNSNWSSTEEENGKEVVYKPDPAFLDKLANINFIPRRAIVFPELTFYPPALKFYKVETIRDTLRVKSKRWTDNRSLTYFIYGETDRKGKYQENNIQQIIYTAPTEIFTHVSDQSANP